MKQLIAAGLTFCLAMWFSSVVSAQNSPPIGDLQVSADTLGAVVLGQKIRLMMRDGAYIEGKVLRASQNEIYMRINKSPSKGLLPQGSCRAMKDLWAPQTWP